MAPKQKTFELIPVPVGLGGLDAHQQTAQHGPLSKPPMTTKQAKKLYRKATKGPKLSKAEQRRIELLEQDRIRKEFEKERNQARARTARDRKKAKQDKDKQDRRRKGLPLVDVHPSQDTISRFVRPNKTVVEAIKEEEAAAESATETESTTDAGEAEEAPGAHHDNSDNEKKDSQRDQHSGQGAAKRRRLGGSQSADPVSKTVQAIASASVSRATSIDIDDPANQDVLQQQIIADVVLASSRKTCGSSPIEQRLHADADADPVPPREPAPAIATAAKAPPPPQAQPLPSRPPEFMSCKPLTTPCSQPVRPQMARPGRNGQEDARPSRVSFQKPAPPYLPRPAFQSRVPPPKPPPKFKAAESASNYHTAKPRFLPKHLWTPQERPPEGQEQAQVSGALPSNDVPTSTQLFLLNHVDDFFPSPSQEVYELQEEAKSEKTASKTVGTIPALNERRSIAPVVHERRTTGVPSMAAPVQKPHALPQSIEAVFDFPISTQDFTFSSQDMRDIETASKWRREPIPQMTIQDAQLDGQGKVDEGKHVDADCHVDSKRASEHTCPDARACSGDGPASTAARPGPPKKRMFGSSGPGAEVLVAMERSYQQNRREDRAREEARRAQERMLMKMKDATAIDIPEERRTVAEEVTAASQETDYGDLDIGGDDVASFLEDTTWLEDDLDGWL